MFRLSSFFKIKGNLRMKETKKKTYPCLLTGVCLLCCYLETASFYRVWCGLQSPLLPLGGAPFNQVCVKPVDTANVIGKHTRPYMLIIRRVLLTSHMQHSGSITSPGWRRPSCFSRSSLASYVSKAHPIILTHVSWDVKGVSQINL